MAVSDSFQRNAENVASHRCELVEHSWVNKRYKYLRLSAQADLAGRTSPGQFYQLKCSSTGNPQPFLLRPMSVYGVGPEPGAIEFLYNIKGTGTLALAELQVGSAMDIVGPLGNTFTFDPGFKRIMVVVRGVGLATMAPLVKLAAAAGVGVTAIMSARAPEDLMKDEFLRGVAADLHCVVDSDGSSSVAAVDALVRRLLDGAQHDRRRRRGDAGRECRRRAR